MIFEICRWQGEAKNVSFIRKGKILKLKKKNVMLQSLRSTVRANCWKWKKGKEIHVRIATQMVMGHRHVEGQAMHNMWVEC